jgi:nicotinamide mononucleotide adenylyltransferase
MVEGEDWKGLVPARVAEVIESIGGVERVKQIGESDDIRY